MKILELLLITMRPSRWWRIAVMLLPLVVSGGTTNIIVFLKIIVAYMIFALLTGAINIIDDIADFEQDKKDLIKRTLPIASGDLSKNKAEFSLGMLLIGSFVAAFFLSAPFGIAAVLYFFIELCYYLFLKKYAVLDALTIAVEASILLIGGGLICGKNATPWMFIFTIAASVLLVFCEKKRSLFISSNLIQNKFYSVSYNEGGLDQSINITAVFVLIIYSFYTFIALETYGTYLFITVPFVMWGVYRTIMLTYDKSNDKPLEKLLLKDRMLWIVALIWTILTLVFVNVKI